MTVNLLLFGLAVFVLGWAITPVDSLGAKPKVFGFPTAHPLAPGLKCAWVQVRPHDLNDRFFAGAEIRFDGLKWSAVFPCHFNNPRKIFLIEILADVLQRERSLKN